MLSGILFMARWLGTRYEHNREATRTHFYDPP